MDRSDIKEQCTYQMIRGGGLFYVHDIAGRRITYCRVGELERREGSLGRFAAMAECQVENQ